MDIKTNQISQTLNRDRLDVTHLLMRELHSQNQNLQQQLDSMDALFKELSNYVKLCKRCHKIKAEGDYDEWFFVCDICYDQSFCGDCATKFGIGQICTHCFDQWICDKCTKQGHTLKPVPECPGMAII